MLVLGEAGAAGTERGVLPVLRNDAAVATLRASSWSEGATAVVGNREWVLAKTGGELTGRQAQDPEGTARPTLRAEDAMPLHHQVFLLWLELVLRRRGDASGGVFGDGGGDGGGGGE